MPLCASNINLGLLERQWNRLSIVSWQNTDDSDVERLWVDVVNHTDATGEHDFSVVGKFALSVLALPFSNAAVERTSQMNLIRSKLRSRMHQELLESILYVRGFMSINGLCCNSFQPTADMFAKFTTDIYRSVACSEQELEPQEIDF